MVNWERLLERAGKVSAGVMGGFGEIDKSLGRYLQLKEKMEQTKRENDRRDKEEERKSLVDALKMQKIYEQRRKEAGVVAAEENRQATLAEELDYFAKNKQGSEVFNKVKQTWVGLGLPGSTEKQDKLQLVSDHLASISLKKKGAKDNEKNRKIEKRLLAKMSTEERNALFDNPQQKGGGYEKEKEKETGLLEGAPGDKTTSGSPIAKAKKGKVPKLNEMFPSKFSRAVDRIETGVDDFALSMPSGFLEFVEGGLGLVGAEKWKKGVRKGKKKYEEFMGVEDRNSIPSKAGRLAGDIGATIAGGRALKGVGAAVKGAQGLGKLPDYLSKVEKLPKMAKRAIPASLYGAIQAESQDENPLTGALTGAALGETLHQAVNLPSKIMKKTFNRIKKGAKIKDPERILERAELMGPDASIAEIVYNTDEVNALKRKPNFVKAMGKTKQHVEKKADEQLANLPMSMQDEVDLYKNINTLYKEGKEKANKLYGYSKQLGLGEESLLPIETIKKWKKIADKYKNVLPGYKHLKELKTPIEGLDAALNNRALYNLILERNPQYFPLASDLMAYYSKIKNELRSQQTPSHALTSLKKEIEEIIKEADPNSTLKKASNFYADNVVPFMQKNVNAAKKVGVAEKYIEGRPKIDTVFSKQSELNSQLFKNLKSEDKKKVIGRYAKKYFEEESNEVKTINDMIGSLPGYIKETKDPQIIKLLKDLESIGNVKKSITSMSTATASDKGSSQVVDKVLTGSRTARGLAYAGSALMGHPKMAAIVFGLDMGLKGANKAKNAFLRKMMGQKNLRKYFNPELIKEIETTGKFSRPMTKLIEEKS